MSEGQKKPPADYVIIRSTGGHMAKVVVMSRLHNGSHYTYKESHTIYTTTQGARQVAKKLAKKYGLPLLQEEPTYDMSSHLPKV